MADDIHLYHGEYSVLRQNPIFVSSAILLHGDVYLPQKTISSAVTDHQLSSDNAASQHLFLLHEPNPILL